MHAQYKDGVFKELVGNIVFSATVYQTAESLTPEQKAEFDVYNIVDIQPALEPNKVYAESWTYEIDGADIKRIWTLRDLTPEEIEANRKASIPQSVTMRQARLALDAAGLLDTVEAAVAASPRAVQIEWEYAQTVDRTWPTLVTLQAALGLTDEQIDGLFVDAAAR